MCQVLVNKQWCSHNSRTASLHKEHLQLLDESGMIPDALILRIIAAFRHPVRFDEIMIIIIVFTMITIFLIILICHPVP